MKIAYCSTYELYGAVNAHPINQSWIEFIEENFNFEICCHIIFQANFLKSCKKLFTQLLLLILNSVGFGMAHLRSWAKQLVISMQKSAGIWEKSCVEKSVYFCRMKLQVFIAEVVAFPKYAQIGSICTENRIYWRQIGHNYEQCNHSFII